MHHYNRRTLFPATLSVSTFFRLFRKKIFKLDYRQFLRFSARSELKIGAVVIAFVRNGRKPLAAVDINFNRAFVENRNYIGLVAVQRNYRVACRKPNASRQNSALSLFVSIRYARFLRSKRIFSPGAMFSRKISLSYNFSVSAAG